MKFKIDKEVFKKFPTIVIAIPVIKGFKNDQPQKIQDEIYEMLCQYAKEVGERFKNDEELKDHPYIKAYFDAFKVFGANPEKVKPTHFALALRAIEGKSMPNINPVVNIYNALSLKYLSPYGGEDITAVYGDFVLKFANGDEEWQGIGETKFKSPKKGDLIWQDDYDVSTISLNWRQCERTKSTEKTSHAYFIMDGFSDVNKENILRGAQELCDVVTKYLGGTYKILFLDQTNPEVEYEFETRKGAKEKRLVVKKEKIDKASQQKREVKYIYSVGSIQSKIQEAIARAVAIDRSKVVINPTADRKFGDFTSPIAMQIGKEQGRNPLEVAREIENNINPIDGVSEVEAVVPGFLNFHVSEDNMKEELIGIKDSFGNSNENAGKQIMVEYGQPNTHKTITVGHVKSAITGLCIARLYESTGYDVIHSNYFGDFGPYVAKTLYSLFCEIKKDFKLSDLNSELVDKCIEYVEKIKNEEGLKGISKLIDRLYSQASLKYESDEAPTGIIKDINDLLFDKSSDELNRIYKYTRELCIDYQNEFFGKLGVKYDRQYPESEVSEEGKNIVLANVGKVFEEDDGAIIFPGDKYGVIRYVYLTARGNPTYSGKDLGLVELKFKEYPNLEFCLITTSVEQNEYFRSLIKSIELIHPEYVGKYRHLGFGWLLLNNKKTSSRKGKKITYDDMIEEATNLAKEKISELKQYSKEEVEEIAGKVAIAGFKFNILSHEIHKDINYNPESFMSLSGFSAPYILYSYARAKSILGSSKEKDYKVENIKSVYKKNEEVELIKKILEFPRVVQSSAKGIMPHILCKYLFELANTFNAFYTTCHILNEEDKDIRISRLILLQKTVIVLKNGLYILGIDTVEKM